MEALTVPDFGVSSTKKEVKWTFKLNHWSKVNWILMKNYYGLTDQRVIVLSGLFGKKTKSLNLRTLTDISLTEKTDGKGTILFGQDNPWSSWFGGGWFPGMDSSQTPRFEMI